MRKMKMGSVVMAAMCLFSMTVFAEGDNSSQLLKNGDFSEGKTGWSPWVTPAVAKDATMKFENNQLEVTISQALGNMSHVQLIQFLAGIQVGDDLCLTFEAKATSEGKVSVTVTQQKTPFGSCGLFKDAMLKTEWTKCEYTFKLTKNAAENPAILRIFMGNLDAGTYLFKNFSLTKVTAKQ